MRYSIEPRDRIYVKGHGFLSFAKKIGKNVTKVVKSIGNKYSQKLHDSAKKSTTDAIKTASKRGIQKTAETTDDLIGNKIADKRTSISNFLNELHSLELHLTIDENEIEIPKERYISPEKRQQIIDILRLV